VSRGAAASDPVGRGGVRLRDCRSLMISPPPSLLSCCSTIVSTATDNFCAADRDCTVPRGSKLCSTIGMSAVVRPDWWCYPLQCSAGHPWAPGRVTVGWMPCDCPSARAHGVLGHLWVRCRTEGCPSIWYRPRHELPEAGAPRASLISEALAGRPNGGRCGQVVSLWPTVRLQGSGRGAPAEINDYYRHRVSVIGCYRPVA
jgi:hypothetical protein